MKILKYIFLSILLFSTAQVFAQRGFWNPYYYTLYPPHWYHQEHARDNISYKKKEHPDAYMSITHSSAISIGNSRSFIDNNSFIGWGFDYRKTVGDQWTIGGSIQSNRLYQNIPGYSIVEGSDGTHYGGKEFRYLDAFSLMVTSHYYTGEFGKFRTFIGGGVGTYYINREQEVGMKLFYDEAWHLGVAPEIGLYLPIYNKLHLSSSLKYNVAIKNNTRNTQSWISGNIGIGWIF
ncbi:hypothetical protein [Algivirga pacifica]|uniref:Outer membrane protein beta-barrel domain-containing protein n=1 Tax=Algivirga pacifica TaxID=1162670 RepID=A0ABP9DKN2_9BACT